MAHPAAVLFALSMAVWVVDVRFAPVSSPPLPVAPVAACQSGASDSPPDGADAEVVSCGARTGDHQD